MSDDRAYIAQIAKAASAAAGSSLILYTVCRAAPSAPIAAAMDSRNRRLARDLERYATTLLHLSASPYPHHAQATCCKCLAMDPNFPDGLSDPEDFNASNTCQ